MGVLIRWLGVKSWIINNIYDDEYYIDLPMKSDDRVFLIASEQTGSRKYHRDELLFSEGDIDFLVSKNRSNKYNFGSVLFNAYHPIISENLYDRINKYSVKGFQLFPCVIRKVDGKLLNDYYFFNIYHRLDCIDFGSSDILNYNPSNVRHEFLRYSFSKSVLDSIDSIDEEERLIVKPKGTSDGIIFIHETIVRIIEKNKVDNVRFVRVSDCHISDQFK